MLEELQLVTPATQCQLEFDHSHFDPVTLVLSSGETFGVFDRWGDVQNIGQRLQGIFHQGMRFLSRYELRVFGRRPFLLSSTIREDNDILLADLSNPRLELEGEILKEGSLHLQRIKMMRVGLMLESLAVKNYTHKPIELTFT